MEKELIKGTTTVAMVCKDGVVMAAERRAVMGTLIVHKVAKKMFKIDENLGLTVAGLVGDAQLLARWLAAEAEIYRLRRAMPMSVKAAATLMANIMVGQRFFPYWVQLLVCGIDSEGSHVYSLDPAGGSIRDKYVATGSGSPFVYGILEDHYKDDMSINEATDLAIRALVGAMKRDAVSGDGIDVVTITKKGYQELTEAEIEKSKQKLKL